MVGLKLITRQKEIIYIVMNFSLIKQKLLNGALGVVLIAMSVLSPGSAKAADTPIVAFDKPFPSVGVTGTVVETTVSLPVVGTQSTTPLEEEVRNPTPEEVRAEIIRQAHVYGVSVKTALRIARCESGYQYNARNSTSSAKGVYQFIDGTWRWINAQGHQFDYKENIRQFMKWYPQYPQWWECK